MSEIRNTMTSKVLPTQNMQLKQAKTSIASFGLKRGHLKAFKGQLALGCTPFCPLLCFALIHRLKPLPLHQVYVLYLGQ